MSGYRTPDGACTDGGADHNYSADIYYQQNSVWWDPGEEYELYFIDICDWGKRTQNTRYLELERMMKQSQLSNSLSLTILQ